VVDSASGGAQGTAQRGIPRGAGIVGAALGVVAAGTADEGRIEVRAFEKDIYGLCAHLAGSAPHHSCDADGTFVLRSAAPGKYKIVALRNGWDMEWSNPAVLKPYLKTAESLEIAANQKYVVKVAVQ